MSSPTEWYNTLPPITKAYGTVCVVVTAAYHLGLYDPLNIALSYPQVVYHFQVWRLFTNFFFLGSFSNNFGIHVLIIARYAVQLEKGPFERRTVDFLWMIIFGAFAVLALSAIPIYRTPYLARSVVFMLLFVWSTAFPNAQVNIYGLAAVKGFYLPWAMLALDFILGSHIRPDALGLMVGHIYCFLTEMHLRAGGKDVLKTPMWLHKLVARWRIGPPPVSGAKPERSSRVLKGRSYFERLLLMW